MYTVDVVIHPLLRDGLLITVSVPVYTVSVVYTVRCCDTSVIKRWIAVSN